MYKYASFFEAVIQSVLSRPFPDMAVKPQLEKYCPLMQKSALVLLVNVCPKKVTRCLAKSQVHTYTHRLSLALQTKPKPGLKKKNRKLSSYQEVVKVRRRDNDDNHNESIGTGMFVQQITVIHRSRNYYASAEIQSIELLQMT